MTSARILKAHLVRASSFGSEAARLGEGFWPDIIGRQTLLKLETRTSAKGRDLPHTDTAKYTFASAIKRRTIGNRLRPCGHKAASLHALCYFEL
jgi:hypothetical protein